MSFTFGPFDFSSMPEGSYAIQREFPWVSGLSIESLEIPGMERRRFLETNRPATTIALDTIVRGDTEELVEEAKDTFETYLDPSLGPQQLIFDEKPEWYWEATVSGEVMWEKLYWNCHSGYAYRSTVTFESYNDAAQRRVDEDVISIDGETTVELTGNTRAWPTLELQGTLGAGDTVTIMVQRGSRDIFTVHVDGPLSSGQTMRLNYDEMQFAVWSGDTKVASLVNRMDNLDRLELRRLEANVVAVSGATAVIYPNSRKQ